RWGSRADGEGRPQSRGILPGRPASLPGGAVPRPRAGELSEMHEVESFPTLAVAVIIALLTLLVSFVTVRCLGSSAFAVWRNYRLTGGIAVFVVLYPLFMTTQLRTYRPINRLPTDDIAGSWTAYQFGSASFWGIWTFSKDKDKRYS